MARKNELDDLYLRFLNLKQAVENVTRLETLDAIEEQILQYVAKTYLAGKALCVTDLVAKSGIASPVTIHRRLKHLRRAGYITIDPVANEYPKKNISLTPNAVRYFNELAKGLRTVSAG